MWGSGWVLLCCDVLWAVLPRFCASWLRREEEGSGSSAVVQPCREDAQVLLLGWVWKTSSFRSAIYKPAASEGRDQWHKDVKTLWEFGSESLCRVGGT